MLSKLSIRLTTAHLIAFVALFFAIGGPSFAANAVGNAARLITGKQIKNSSITAADVKDGSLLLADFKGGQLPPGPVGPTGPMGPGGSQGPKGDTGAAGHDGTNGTNGTNGANGTSVTSTPEPPGANCATGGAKFTSASPATYACNGAKGDPGTNGTQGIQGIQGPPGPRGFDEITRPTVNLVTGAASFATGTATCDANHPRVIGGGVDTFSNEDFGVVEESYPNGTNAWSVRMRNNGSNQPLSSTVFAICVA